MSSEPEDPGTLMSRVSSLREAWLRERAERLALQSATDAKARERLTESLAAVQSEVNDE
jgi:chaperonin cofactor prefoldin